MENQIFIVEDDRFYSTILQEELRSKGVSNTKVFNDVISFLKNLHKMPKIVLLDHKLGTHNGIDILKRIKAFNKNIEVIFLSGQDSLNIAVMALKYGAFDYVEKNEGAIPRVVSLISRVFQLDNLMIERRNEKKYKALFLGSIACLFTVLIYYNVTHPQIFNM